MFKVIALKSTVHVVPMIYAYTTPEIKRHDGWIKIGYTEQDVDKRLKQQTHTADVEYNLEWKGTAIFDDGSGDAFKDHEFHAYLRKNGIKQEPGKNNEWFQITKSRSHDLFIDFKSDRGILKTLGVSPYSLRNEQDDAVEKAKDYFLCNDHGQFLWNAKPRFGKTLAVYDLCKRMSLSNILIVTNRPAIANSWYSDYCKFLGDESGFRFVSEASSIKDAPYSITWNDFERLRKKDPSIGCIEFLSLQDLKGSLYFGGRIDKLQYIKAQKWDLLVIDEAHEGVDTSKTDVAFDHIDRKWTLHLSGTPFKALANAKFPSDAIYNWTYADEQKAKRDFVAEPGTDNPYADLPQLTMYTYQMSNIVEDKVREGIVIDENTEEYAFDLNEFFATGKNGKFIHEESVDRFLDALTTQEKFPFSTEELRGELKHTLWLLNRVDSAKALYKKLDKHPVFSKYGLVLAAGDGKIDDADETQKAYDKVREKISECDRSITLSVGQLTTGVTIPEWTAALMLSNIKSPALYMQAAFRAQNPCLFRENGQFYRKENAFVFDFDPARTLDIFEKFANDLSTDTSSGRGDSDTRRNNVRKLLNFFPVIGEDDRGQMVELDAEQVLSIPRKIRSKEVVRRGFMSDFLFQNISNLFHAPQKAWDLVNTFEAVKQPDNLVYSQDELDLDQNGDIEIPKEKVVGKHAELFGDKIYSIDQDDIEDALEKAKDNVSSRTDDMPSELVKAFSVNVTEPMIQTAKDKYGPDLSQSATKSLKRKINSELESKVKKEISNYTIQRNELNVAKEKELRSSRSDVERAEIEKRYSQKHEEISNKFNENVKSTITDMTQTAGDTIVEKIEEDRQQKVKTGLEDNIRDHLRGFSRTIPSFLMAYGTDKEVTLANFDTIVPEDVFKDVTSITLEDFRFLRDGGDYKDEETGETKRFDGQLFDPVVFDDSVKEFLSLRKKLANYFDESTEGDIFDYIPPQKTNQIFTPKKVVREMVDMLEKENPGCFDDPSKTFADLYMKSGLYIAEIVKRLYRSDNMKRLFPDGNERLRHIFAEQVYGLAPTEIIYRITLSFLLGFSDEISIEKHNLRLCNSLQYTKEGDLEDKLEELYGRRPSDGQRTSNR